MLFASAQDSKGLDDELNIDDLNEVQSELQDIRSKWYQFGLYLQLTPGHLDEIDVSIKNGESKLREVLERRIFESVLTWRIIIEALKKIGHNALAAKLEAIYSPKQQGKYYYISLLPFLYPLYIV